MRREASAPAGALVGAVSGLAGAVAALWFAQTAVPKVVDAAEGGRHVRQGRLSPAGLSLHAGFGLAAGAVYGVLAEYVPGVTAGFGAAAGVALWAATEPKEVAGLGLAKWPDDGTAEAAAAQMAMYAVFGTVMEGVRRVTRLEFD